MNKFLTIVVVLTVVCSAVIAKNSDNPKASTGMAVVKSGSGFKLYYKGSKPSDVKVTILDAQGQALYKETLKNIESFVRPYNFSTLKDGSYTIELENEDGKQQQAVKYATGGNKERLMSLVRMRGSENKYVLSVANKGTDVLTVRVFDSAKNVIYSGTEEINGNFARIYTLNGLEQDFQIEVTGKDGNSQLIQYNR